MACDRQEQLRQAALAVLQRIDALSKEQVDTLQEGDYDRLLTIDKQIETAFGEKERAFGALLNHCREHGCAFSTTV